MHSPVLSRIAWMLTFTELVELSDNIVQVLSVVVTEHDSELSLHFLEIDKSSEERRQDVILAFTEQLLYQWCLLLIIRWSFTFSWFLPFFGLHINHALVLKDVVIPNLVILDPKLFSDRLSYRHCLHHFLEWALELSTWIPWFSKVKKLCISQHSTMKR